MYKIKIFFSQNNTFLSLVKSSGKLKTEKLQSPSNFSLGNQILDDKNETSRFISLKNKYKNENVRKKEESTKVIFQLSAGLCGARNAKKTKLVDPMIATFLEKTPIRSFSAEVRGFSPIRERFLNALMSSVQITDIIDTTSIAHNGCRAPKKRRL